MPGAVCLDMKLEFCLDMWWTGCLGWIVVALPVQLRWTLHAWTAPQYPFRIVHLRPTVAPRRLRVLDRSRVIGLVSRALPHLANNCIAVTCRMHNLLDATQYHPADLLSWLMIVAGAASFAAELAGTDAPYGRYQRTGWGLGMNASLAWMTQELPALLIPLGMILAAGATPLLENATSPRSFLAAAFLLHYTQRSLLYPLLIRGGKPTPLGVWAMAFAFCCWNGYLQGDALTRQLPLHGTWAPHQVAGLLLWGVGWAANLHCDHILRNLRKGPTDKRYYIPRGGLFEYVSAANYTAEMLEWSGYALAAWSLPAVAFAWFTFCNLAPRGVAHHRWYQQRFKTYPRQRRAVIPFIW